MPLLAGIPVTQRGVSSSVHVSSGHAGADPGMLAALAAGSTVVLLMAVASLAEICEAAVAQGVTPDLPVAVVENGSTDRQRVTFATLSTVARAAAERGVRSPAVVVVGAVAAPGLLDDGEARRRPEMAERQRPPALVLCAHGTRDPHGRATVREVVAAVADRLPGVEVLEAFVDVHGPEVDAVVAGLPRAPARSARTVLPEWPASWCRCCSRRATTCTSTSPGPWRSAPTCARPAPSGPTTCSSTCSSTGSRPLALSGAGPWCWRRPGRATRGPRPTARTWPSASPPAGVGR